MESLFMFCMYAVIISLLLIVRKYQKANKKLINILIKVIIDNYKITIPLNEKTTIDNLDDMERKYKLLLKILDGIELEKNEEVKKGETDEEIS